MLHPATILNGKHALGLAKEYWEEILEGKEQFLQKITRDGFDSLELVRGRE